MKKSIFTLILFLVHSLWSLVYHPLFAQSSSIPHLINFQSVLTDTAGIPLPNGLYDVDFRIVDANGEIEYQETQKLEAASGVVSAMIGAQGEMNLTIFDPERPKFLEVEVLGNGPAKTMEIVTVPYSLFAEQALNVAPQSIGAEAIQPGSITRELLSEALLSDLEGTPTGANQIGVESGFLYSRGTNTQTVLKDLDTAIHQRQVNLESLRSRLQTNIDQERTERLAETAGLQNTITQERSERVAAINNLQGQISTANSSISTNQSATESRLAGVEQNVDTLINSPQIRAAGIVNVTGGGRSVTVNFAPSVSPPYTVLTTPIYDVSAALPGGAPSVLITSTSEGSFVVNTNWAVMPSFHFVVVK